MHPAVNGTLHRQGAFLMPHRIRLRAQTKQMFVKALTSIEKGGNMENEQMFDCRA